MFTLKVSEYAERLSRRFFGPDNELSYFKLLSRTGNAAPKEMIDRIRSSPAWKKAAKTVVPFAPFFRGGTWWADLENWRFLYSGDKGNWYIVGDNPIVTHGDNDHDPVTYLKEFIFPISGRISLISFNGRISKVLPPEFAIQYGAAIIERAQRFVAGHNKGFLEALIRDYKLHIQFGKTGGIIMELFEMLGEPEERGGST